MATPGSLLNIGPAAGQNHFNVGIGYPTGHVDKSQAQIAAGFSDDDWFHLNSAGTAVVFSAPLNGGKTSANTSYARSELREFDQDGTTKALWNPSSGTHYITGRTKITKLPPVKPQVCVAQMHDPDDDTAMILSQLISGKIQLVARINGTRVVTLNSDYTVGTEFQWKIEVTNGVIKFFYNNMTTPVYTGNQFVGVTKGQYYKAGCYNQSNTTIDQLEDGPFIIELRDFSHWHTGWPTPTVPGGGSSTPGGSTGGGGSQPSGTLYDLKHPDGTPYAVIGEGLPASIVNVTNSSQLTAALSAATPGQRIRLASGTYTGDFQISGKTGSAANGITIEAVSHLGPVFTSGSSFTVNNSSHVTVRGLSFPFDAAGDTLSIRGSSSHHVRYTRNLVGPTTRTNSATASNMLYAQDKISHIRFDHNTLRNKGTSGNAIRVYGDFTATGGITYFRVDHNLVQVIADEVGNDKECIRCGTSDMSLTVSNGVVERNVIEAVLAEPEVISLKLSNIRCTGNVVRNSAGGIVIRHGRNTVVADNYIIDTASTTASGGLTSGGFRGYDSDHKIQYNYVEGVIGDNHEASLIIDTGDAGPTSGALNAHWVPGRWTVTRNVIVGTTTGIQVGDNYSINPYDITLTDNVVARTTSGAAVTFTGSTTLDGASTNSGNTYTATETLAGLVKGPDGVWRKADYGPRLSLLAPADVGVTGDPNDTDGTGGGSAPTDGGGGSGTTEPDPPPPLTGAVTEPDTAIPTFVDGVLATHDDLTALSQNFYDIYSVQLAGFRTRRPLAQARVTATNRAVANNTDVLITWDAEDLDTDGLFAAGGTTFTAARAGVYHFGCSVALNPVSAGTGATQNVWITRNSTARADAYAAGTGYLGSGVGSAAGAQGWAFLAAGDVLRFYVRQNSGNSVNLNTGAGGCRAWVYFVNG